MESSSRRHFIKMLGATSVMGHGVSMASSRSSAAPSTSKIVKFRGDGLSLSPEETLAVLRDILDTRGIEPDYYSRGGVVEELETEMASALGKERAIYFPTGTLANHVALRALAKGNTRAIVPKESHIYNDSGDCAQQLSQLNLIPLSSDSATFSLEQVREAVSRSSTGRVTTGIGAIFIESPVRRKLGEMFDFEEMKKICAFAKEEGIGTHLDGARLYMASAYSGISPRDYAALFDTVYVSLWKYFNAGSGAILAGSAETIDELYHTRRMFGGGLPGVWPFAAVALHYFKTFEAEYKRAVQTAEELFTRLGADERFRLEKIRNGSNIFKLRLERVDLDRFQEQLKASGILVSSPNKAIGGFFLNVNPTLNRSTVDFLAETFNRAAELSPLA